MIFIGNLSVVRILDKLLKKPQISIGIVAISFLPNGVAVAVTNYAVNNRPRLLHSEFIPATTAEVLSKLEKLNTEYMLQDYDCHVLLTTEQYRTISIEAPSVADNELKEAITWRIAELLDYPVEQAIVDFYALPKSNRANTNQMLEVIACQSKFLDELIQPCQQAGLNIKVIDIQETALRNLATLLRENDQGIALMYFQENSGRVIIQKGGELYLARKINSGYQQLDIDSVSNQISAVNFELDGLALDIQRSFDYVENYYNIPPITSLATVLMPINTQNIINFLNNNHGITARAMDLSAIVDCDFLLDDFTQNLCAPVIGASLRRALEAESS